MAFRIGKLERCSLLISVPIDHRFLWKEASGRKALLQGRLWSLLGPQRQVGFTSLNTLQNGTIRGPKGTTVPLGFHVSEGDVQAKTKE